MSADAQTLSVTHDGFHPPPRWTLADTEQSWVTPFELHAAQHPDRLAVLGRTERLTYGDLNARANRLAHALIARAARDDRVALALGHDAAMIVGLLATWKAGMVAVPLEMTHPVGRLASIVVDAGCAMIVSEPLHQSVAAELARHGARFVAVDEPGNDWPDSDPRLDVAPGDLACLVYTSGSTGKPKGVMQTHRHALRNIVGYSNVIGIVPEDRLVLLASCAAAQGLSTVACALTNGASLFPFSVREAGVEQLAQFIRQQAITLYISAATVFRHLVLTLGAHEVLESVRMVRLGSEPIHGSDAAAFRRHFRPDCMMLTALSCTETANITLHHVDPARDADLASVPVGWPVDGMEVLLLDNDGNDVGVDREGEIVVRSRYLSPGYWRDDQRTAAAFNAATDGSDRRCYHTGDLGRRRADGCLVHMGRRDFRVKVRGFGVELEEVETVLRQHPRVKAAVASVRQDQLGDNTLVAHVVAQPGEKLALEDVQQHVLARLAAHMLPAQFFVLDALPSTPNGKVDRRAVAALAGDVLRKSSSSVPPRTTLERQLVRTWESVLSYRPIGVEDDFFAVGGNSLLAGLVISRAIATFGVDLPLRTFLEHPTIVGLTRLVRKQRVASMAGGVPAIARVPRDRPITASFAQQRLWLLDQIEPGSNAYNIPRAMRLEGRLDRAALERALREMVRRHETLRTTFATVNDQPVQVIAEDASFALQLVDCATATDDSGHGERRMREHLAAEAMRPFDLHRGPLFRAALFRLSDVEHVLLLNLHHIISDLWSNAVLTRELSELYTAFSQGQSSPLPELTVQYADFAVWQRDRLQGARLQRQCDYWSARLAGLPALDLPTDRPRPREPATASALVPVEIPPELTGALGKLARDNQSTLYMTLLAVYQTLLHRYTGQEDFAVGGVIAGRNHVAVETLIGFFINTLVHRADVSGHPTFLELLGRVRASALGAFEHQDLPFERLVEELNPPRDVNRAPFFQVTFLLQNTPRTKLTMPGLTVTSVETGRGAAKFDLTFSLHEEAGRLRGAVDFNPALFDRATVQRLIGHFHTLCEGVARDPAREVADLPMLTAAERTELLDDFNRPTSARAGRTVPGDGAATLTEAFATQVRRTPDATAVVFEDTRLTYRELDERASRLAQVLQELGAGTDRLVGVCLERSLDLVVGILAVLKSGAAYLPVDPGYPPNRVSYMLENSEVALVLTHSRLVPRLPAKSVTPLCLDTFDWSRPVTQEAQATARRHPTPENLAYVLYTSGSTGNPKGVMIPHAAICNQMAWMQAEFPLTPDDRVLQKTPISFDASVWEFYAPLFAGATLVLARPGDHADPALLAGALHKHRITILQIVPSMAQMLVEEPLFAGAHKLRRLFCGGEALPLDLLGRLAAAQPCAELVNLYGPTEATINATFWRWRPGITGTTAPIGRPVANTPCYIVDRRLQPVPVGVTGELCIGGIQVGRGYHAQRELTAERFIADPFASCPEARLYKTGDLCRYRPDGTIEYLGRIDHQVKIRGNRIELGEIEAVLATHPAIEHAVVVASETPAHDRRLIAYLVARKAHRWSVSELRDFLRARLPEYMMPATFVPLPSLPLTPHGKVDRKSLPQPDAGPTEAVRPFVAPHTPGEERLAAIWHDVLRRERIGADDDFFELGGHSLLAMQVVARVRRMFGCDLPLRALFDHPTVAGLAAAIDGLSAPRLPHPTDDPGSPVDFEEDVI